MQTDLDRSENQKRIALVGSPNSGKTTLFNVLTGSRQKTGNYPGVTVEKKEGELNLKQYSVELLDLPGTYSLEAHTPDELVTAQVVSGQFEHEAKPNLVLAVADSTNLQTNLYLVLELIELGIPTVLVLTMTDLAKQMGLFINENTLSAKLKLPIVRVSSITKQGLDELLATLEKTISNNQTHAEDHKEKEFENSSQKILGRYKKIEEIVDSCVTTQETKRKHRTERIDRIVLHKIAGPLILFLIFGVMFQSIFSLAQIPMEALQDLVGALQVYFGKVIGNEFLRSLINDGVLAGVGSVIVFLPQILILFTFILFFEDTGYMARAAFIMDRLMGKVGLHGRAFIPLLSSFACAVPGIMATRTIENRRDRLITILVAPLMTCSARIPVYTMLIATVIPNTTVVGFLNLQGLVLLGLYVAGVLSALAVAFVLRHTVFKKEKSSFLLELPTYKLPTIHNITLGLWTRAKIFLRRAGTIILAAAVVMWFLASFPQTPGADSAAQLENSFAGKIGKTIEPVLSPLGFDWKISVSILSSLAAREVVLSTLATVYSVEREAGLENSLGSTLRQTLRNAGITLPTALSLLVFYILACQCLSTLAVTKRETNSLRWPVFMFTYMSVLAYLAAWCVYQISSHTL